MSARDELLREMVHNHLYMTDERATELLDAYRAEVLAKAIGRLRAIPVTCTALTGPVWYGDGWNSAITCLEEIAEYQTPDDEAYPGELQMLRALALGIRVAARKADMDQVQRLALDHAARDGDAREQSSRPVAEPLVVSRFDTAMEPAPEEEQVLIIGAIAEDGRPVALLLDVEDRRKVADWLTPKPVDPDRLYRDAYATGRSHAGADGWVLRQFTPVFTTSDGSDRPVSELRCTCGHLLQGVGEHTLIDLMALAAQHQCGGAA